MKRKYDCFGMIAILVGSGLVSGRIDLDYQINADSKILFNVWGYDQEFW